MDYWKFYCITTIGFIITQGVAAMFSYKGKSIVSMIISIIYLLICFKVSGVI